MNSMSRLMTSLKEDTRSRHSLPFSPAAMMAPPKNRAMTMTCSMLAVRKASHMLEGKIPTRVDMKPPNSAAS